jgi:hypothetical protein
MIKKNLECAFDRSRHSVIVLGLAGLIIATGLAGGCSSSRTANTGPNNSVATANTAPTPTVQEIIDAKRKAAEEAKAADPNNQMYEEARKRANSVQGSGLSPSASQQSQLIKRSTDDYARKATSCPTCR